jgi:hypothetical protein
MGAMQHCLLQAFTIPFATHAPACRHLQADCLASPQPQTYVHHLLARAPSQDSAEDIYIQKATQAIASGNKYVELGQIYKAKECITVAIEYLGLAKLKYRQDKAFKYTIGLIDTKIGEYTTRADDLEADIQTYGNIRPKSSHASASLNVE